MARALAKLKARVLSQGRPAGRIGHSIAALRAARRPSGEEKEECVEAVRGDPGLQRGEDDRGDRPAGPGGARREGDPHRGRRLDGRDPRHPPRDGREGRRARLPPAEEPGQGRRGVASASATPPATSSSSRTPTSSTTRASTRSCSRPIEDGHADVVFGSRFLGGGERRVLYFWHTVGNRFLTLASNMATNLNLTDMETCYKMFRREVVQSMTIESSRFGIEPEITAKVARRGYRVYEVPISYHGRTYDEGKKIGWKDAVSALWTIVKHRFRESEDAGNVGHVTLTRLAKLEPYNRWLVDRFSHAVGKRVLEIGAGFGNLTRHFAETDPRGPGPRARHRLRPRSRRRRVPARNLPRQPGRSGSRPTASRSPPSELERGPRPRRRHDRLLQRARAHRGRRGAPSPTWLAILPAGRKAGPPRSGAALALRDARRAPAAFPALREGGARGQARRGRVRHRGLPVLRTGPASSAGTSTERSCAGGSCRAASSRPSSCCFRSCGARRHNPPSTGNVAAGDRTQAFVIALPRRAGPAILFVLLVAAAYSDPLLARRNFGGRDVLGGLLPMESAIHDAYSRGRLPVWAADISGGPAAPGQPQHAARSTRCGRRSSVFPFPFAIRLFPVLHWVARRPRGHGASLRAARLQRGGVDRRGDLRVLGRRGLGGLLHEPHGRRRPAPVDPLGAREAVEDPRRTGRRAVGPLRPGFPGRAKSSRWGWRSRPRFSGSWSRKKSRGAGRWRGGSRLASAWGS